MARTKGHGRQTPCFDACQWSPTASLYDLSISAVYEYGNRVQALTLVILTLYCGVCGLFALSTPAPVRGRRRRRMELGRWRVQTAIWVGGRWGWILGVRATQWEEVDSTTRSFLSNITKRPGRAANICTTFRQSRLSRTSVDRAPRAPRNSRTSRGTSYYRKLNQRIGAWGGAQRSNPLSWL